MLQVGWRHVELPAVVAALRLESDSGRLSAQAGLVEMPASEIFVDRAARQDALRCAHHALVCFDAIVFQQFDGALGGQMTAAFVGGSQFKRRDQFAVALQLRFRQHARFAMIDTMRRPRLEEVFERAIHRSRRDVIQFGHGQHL